MISSRFLPRQFAYLESLAAFPSSVQHLSLFGVLTLLELQLAAEKAAFPAKVARRGP